MVKIWDAILNIWTNSELKKWHRPIWDSTHSNEHFDTKKSLLAAQLSWSGIFGHCKPYYYLYFVYSKGASSGRMLDEYANTRLYTDDAVWYRHPSGQPTWHDVTGYDRTWQDVTWSGMKWRDVTWHDVTWRGMIWRDLTWQDVSGRDRTWHDVTWRDMTWHDMTWLDVAWRDMTWHDVKWCGMTWNDVTWCAMTWHDMTWRDMTRHDETWRDMTWHDVTWRDMTMTLTIKHWLCDRHASFRAIAYTFRAFLIYFRMHNLPGSFVQISWIAFELAKKI